MQKDETGALPENTDRPRGIFTKDDRLHIYGRKSYNHPSQNSHAKSRIRKRAYHGLLDSIYLNRLDEDELNKIFTMWREVEPPAWDNELPEDSPMKNWNPYENQNVTWQKEAFTESLFGWVALIYQQLEKQELADAQQLFEHAIIEAERSLGNDVDAEVNLTEPDTEIWKRQFEKGKSLDSYKIQHLRDEGVIEDVQELVDYYDNLN